MKIRLRDGTGTIELKYVWEDMDRHGNVRIYFKKGTGPKIRLRSKPGTPEFTCEYRTAFEGQAPVTVTRHPSPRPESFRWLVERYFEAAAFKELDERTQRIRRRFFDRFCERHGAKPYAQLLPRHVAGWRDEKLDTPMAANELVKTLRALFKWACDPAIDLAQNDPTRRVTLLRPKNPDGHHAWTREEVQRYRDRHPLGTASRLAMDLLLLTGVRRSDVVQLGPQMETESGWLRFTERKGRKRKPKHRELPILPELRESINATPRAHLAYLVTAFGRPFTENGFGNWFRKRCDEAGLFHCSAHGLRKAGAVIAAENGATVNELMAIYGWTKAQQAELYTRQANRKTLTANAIGLVVPRSK